MKKCSVWILLFILIGFLFFSCASGSDWYPTGKVEISKYRVYDTPDGLRNCTVFYKVSNTGQSRINQSTVSIQLDTDKGSYLTTVVNTTVVLPGKSIYGSVNISFFDITETVNDSGSITVTDYFFE